MTQPDEPVPRPRPPLVRLARGQEVSLGCGTLILIAIIVAICSGAGKTDLTSLQNEQKQMHKALMRIEDRLNELSKKLDAKKG